jgi:AraC-like DNA-binding protein
MYREYPPPKALADLIECFWRHEVTEGDPEPSGVILPDGRVDVVWVAGEEPRLAGPQKRFVERPLRPPFLAVGARFRPGAGPPLLRVPAHELVDLHVPLDAVGTRPAAALGRRLERALDPRAAYVVLTGALAGLADDGVDPLVRRATQLLDRPDTTIREVADEIALSERQLQRRFLDAVGYGPKTLHRILRFRRFLTELARAHNDGLAWIAARTGYADQAHLTRESRALAGLSPVQLGRRWGA